MTAHTIGSLFAGYGGLDLAVESVLPARVAWVSDIDPGACKILAHRAPGVPNLGDITRINWADVEPVDIITGGSPCQDLSHAGRRAGMAEGTRSNLWVSMREAIATIRPKLVVWENVRGALSAQASSVLEHCPGCMGGTEHGGPVLRALGRVLGDLADLGFDAEWHGLRVSDLGGCHGRWRVFVMAWPANSDLAGLQGLANQAGASQAARHGHVESGTGRPDLTLLATPQARDYKGVPGDGFNTASLPRDISLLPTPAAANPNDGETVETWEARRQRTKERVGNGNGFGTPLGIAVQLLPTPAANLWEAMADLSTRTSAGPGGTRSASRTPCTGWPCCPSAALQLDRSDECTDGFAVGSDADSSEHTPGQSDTPGAATASGGSTRTRRGDYADADRPQGRVLLPTPTTEPATGNGHARNLGAEVKPDRWGQYAAAIASHEFLTGRPAPNPTEAGRKGPRLSARFVEWLMCLPDGWVTDVPGITRNEALKALGNGVVPIQCAHALRLMLNRIERTAA